MCSEAYRVCFGGASNMPLTETPEAWPTKRNACEHHPPHYKKAYYCVKGKATLLCSHCVWEYIRKNPKKEMDNLLATHFISDPHGAECPLSTDD